MAEADRFQCHFPCCAFEVFFEVGIVEPHVAQLKIIDLLLWNLIICTRDYFRQ